MATHSSLLTWRIPMDRGAWRLQYVGSQRVRHNGVTKHTQRIKRMIQNDSYDYILVTKRMITWLRVPKYRQLYNK